MFLTTCFSGGKPRQLSERKRGAVKAEYCAHTQKHQMRFQFLSKYFSQFGQIHFEIWTNTFDDLKKNTFCSLDKYFQGVVLRTHTKTQNVLPISYSFSIEIYFVIWTNTFGNLDKCIW